MDLDFKFIEKKKNILELEFDEKEIPVMLVHELTNKGVDAYYYEPHPLLTGFRVHIEAKDALSELKSAVKALDKDWSELKKAVEARLK
jgi:DNA-directed RNA polymerase subunit L